MKEWSQTAHKLQMVLFRDSSTSVIPVVDWDAAENQRQLPTYQKRLHQQPIAGKANNVNIEHKVCQNNVNIEHKVCQNISNAN